LTAALNTALATVAPLVQQAAFTRGANLENFPGEDFDQKAPLIMKKLMSDFSLTKVQAAGIMGNLGHESGGLRILQEVNPIGSGPGGYGWAQWTGSRRTDFQNWCQANGVTMQSDEGNYGFLCHELNGSEKTTIPALKAASTLTVATEVFCQVFERPGIVHLSSRVKWANRALTLFESI
jgi:hypothetical protein